jgi:hypothetical protein
MGTKMADGPNVATLFVFFLGVALCFWRVPQADRGHVVLCLAAAGLWGGLLVFDPATQKSGFVLVTATFLVVSLSQTLRRRAESRLPERGSP